MSNRVKVRDNYELIINRLEKKLDKVSSDCNLYKKLKKILAIISIIVLIFGLWPITLISIILASVCAYQEKDKYKEYCRLIDKLEDHNFELSELKDEMDRERFNAPFIKQEKKEDILSVNSLFDKVEEKNDNKTYCKK